MCRPRPGASMQSGGCCRSGWTGKCLAQALFRVKGFAPLIEDYLSEFGADGTSPVSGINEPVSRLSNVVLPAPLGPTMPTRSPRMIRAEKSRNTAVEMIVITNRSGDIFASWIY